MAPIPKVNRKDASNQTPTLEVAQVLADLNQLKHATDQKAAMSLLQIKDTLERRQSLSRHILPTPSNVFSPPRTRRSTPSHSLQRLSTGGGHAAQLRSESSGTRPGVSPLVRERSSVSGSSLSSSAVTSRASSHGSSMTLKENIQPLSDPDLHRAYTLLTLHSNRSLLLEPSSAKQQFSSNSFKLYTPNINALAINEIIEHYTIMKEEELARDPEGMKRVLQAAGLKG